jgi:hypothetical protein
MLKAWVGPTAPVVPVRVHGPRHITQVAVGEKHSLALQSWVAPVLPVHADLSSDMVAFGPAASAAARTRQVLAVGTAAATAAAAAEDGDAALYEDEDHEFTVSADSLLRQQATASSTSFTSASRSWDLAVAHGADSSSGSSNSSCFPEPLHVLCERVVAQQMVEPRTAPAILEYADVAGGADCAARLSTQLVCAQYFRGGGASGCRLLCSMLIWQVAVRVGLGIACYAQHV